MSYNHTSIKSIIDKLNSSYFVPDIQRSYVWLQNPKLKKIEQLFDSLMRGYPIGSFLFWALKKSDIESDFDVVNESGKLNFQLYKFIENYDARNTSNKKINVSQIVNEDLHIVLDGQQRLTSLYIGLRGTRCLKRAYARANTFNPYEEKRLYLNVLHKPEDENPEDCYRFEFKTEDEVKNANGNELWFRVGKIIDFNNRKEARSYCRERDYSRDATDMVEDLWSVINDDDVISFFEEKIWNNRWWDYSNKFLNINGRICLLSLTFFGLMGSLLSLYAVNYIDKFYSFVNNVIVVNVFVLFVIDLLYSLYKPNVGEYISIYNSNN